MSPTFDRDSTEALCRSSKFWNAYSL